MSLTPRQLEYSRRYRENNREKCREAAREWRLRNPGADVEKHLQRSYGMSLAEYNAQVAAQGGRCAICNGLPNGRVKKLVVDHDHRTNQRRQLLCDACNRAIGLMKENVDTFRAAIKYLQENACSRS